MPDPASPASVTGGSRGLGAIKRLLWKIYLADFDALLRFHMIGGGLAIALLGAFAGAQGRDGAVAAAFLGGLTALIIALAAASEVRATNPALDHLLRGCKLSTRTLTSKSPSFCW